MEKFTVLINPLAGSSDRAQIEQTLELLMPKDRLHFVDITKIKHYQSDLLNRLEPDEHIMLVGGDGTINRFINAVDCETCGHSIYYYAAGNGNDFWNDLGRKVGDAPVCIDAYVKNLPTVTVNDKTYKFINGIGYGIDGYCCEKGDELRAKGEVPNYTKIAISGLLLHYKPKNATVTVDGKDYTFNKVWIAPTMNGRYYGGGMIPTPAQDRLNEQRTVSLCVMYGAGKLPTLMLFPSIFKGEHLRKPKMAQVLTGNTITVRYDKPTPLQIDGETIKNVTEYTVTTGSNN